MSDRMLFAGGRPHGWPPATDLLVDDGRIVAIGAEIEAEGVTTFDAAGLVLLPGLVDAHCHIDKTLFGSDWVPHSAGPELIHRIEGERAGRVALGLPRDEAMSALVAAMVAAGTTSARTHTDVFPEAGGANVQAVRRVADRFAGSIDIQQVGFPQYGILAAPGTADLLADLATDGLIDAVGGVDPAGIDGDPIRSLDIVFETAASSGIGVDLHLHDRGTLGAWQLDLIAAHAERFGLEGRVTVGHAFALGDVDESTRRRLAERLARAGVSVVTAAVYDLPVPSLDLAADHGLVMAGGSDGIRDLWGPYGDGDMLKRAMVIAYRCGLRRDEQIESALDAVTVGGAAVLGIDSRGLQVGAPADLVAVRAQNPAHAVVSHPTRELVMKAGRIVARNGVADPA